jgi:hypothetical protein
MLSAAPTRLSVRCYAHARTVRFILPEPSARWPGLLVRTDARTILAAQTPTAYGLRCTVGRISDVYRTAGPTSLQERCCVSSVLVSVEMFGLLSIHEGSGAQ